MKLRWNVCLTVIVVLSSNAANLETRWQDMGADAGAAEKLIEELKTENADIPNWLTLVGTEAPILADRNAGGPDAFGYTWTDSSEGSGPTFNWVDITTIGTNMALGGDDVTNATPINLPWPFPFYGINKTSFRACTNGFVNFGTSSVAYNNTSLPASGLPNDQIAVFWDDLTTSSQGSVWYWFDSDMNRFIIEWYEVPRYGQQYLPNTFEVILYQNGSIILQYLSVNSTTYNATIGIENSNGTIGLQTHLNGAGMPITNNRAVRYNLIDDLDATPPEIHHTPLENTDNRGPYVVTADIIDGEGDVDWAILYYKVNGGEFIPVTMVSESQSNWTAIIPDQVDFPVTIAYYIVAFDDAIVPNRAVSNIWAFVVASREIRVSNVSASQRPSTGLVDVSYNLWSDNGQNATVTSIFSVDGGANWTLIPQEVYGDIGQSVMPGDGKMFTWNAGVDCPEAILTSVQVKVDACQGANTQHMVMIPSGTFIMGQSGVATPEHIVTLTHSYLLGHTEVTNQQYLEALNWAKAQGLVSVVGDFVQQYNVDLLRINQSGSDWQEIRYNVGTQQFYLHAGTYNSGSNGPGFAYPGGNYDPANHPVKFVSWYGAACYCDWLSQMNNLTTYYNGAWTQIPNPSNPYLATGYRLPTEAEWEFAAQFDDERTYPWGYATRTCALANCWNGYYCVGWTSPVATHPTGTSGLGLQDMAGNQMEWTNDYYAVYNSNPQTDPAGPSTGSDRAERGGYWATSDATGVSCATRFPGSPSTAAAASGFRLCRTLP